MKIIKNFDNLTREKVAQDNRTLYIFTDNTDRSSGTMRIPADSWYYKKYSCGRTLYFPGVTLAIMRGLPNAFPLTTQRWYHGNKKGIAGRWHDDDITEFRKVIEDDINTIVNACKTGQFDCIMIPKDGFFNSKISFISKERCPKIYNCLRMQLLILEKRIESL